MKISRQIKRYRQENSMSQDDLAQRVYVTRQTISNWENEKNYPDIHSILLLCEVFDISLDILVKGDIEEMKKQINSEDVKKFNFESNIFAILFFAVLIAAAPLVILLKTIGIVLWVILYGITMVFAIRIEKQKKKLDIQTYKEIVAFSNGERLDEISKNQEIGKRPYQKILLAVLSAVTAAAVFVLWAWIFRL